MPRIAIIGNAGGGKSTLARRIAAARGLRHVEIDRLLWQEGWVLTPPLLYTQQHEAVIAADDWVIDGLGQQASIAARIDRATWVILVDMPLWMHFWLAAERQIAWATGTLAHPPGGLARMPPTEALFRSIADVDRTWMLGIRSLCEAAAGRGTRLTRLTSVAELDRFAETI